MYVGTIEWLGLMQVELVQPPEGSAPGDRVTVQGYDGEPDDQLNPKKKIFEQVSVERLLLTMQCPSCPSESDTC